MQDYHSLRAWKKARRLAIAIRPLVRTFPRTGYAALKSQMVRSAESIDDNIVEGCGSATNKEFASFLNVAIRSTTELEGQLERARDYGILPRRVWEKYAAEVIDIRKMTSSLRHRVLEAGNDGPESR